MRNVKRLSLIVLALALTACHKHNGQPPSISNLGGGCDLQPAKAYSGAVVQGTCLHNNPCSTHYQFVAVQADVSAYADRISVTLTRADGSTQGIPFVGINLAPQQVQIVNGVENGFVTYAIDEQLCR